MARSARPSARPTCAVRSQRSADPLRLPRPFGAVADFAAIGEPPPRAELRRMRRPGRQVDRIDPARLALDVDGELPVRGSKSKLDFACDDRLLTITIEGRGG